MAKGGDPNARNAEGMVYRPLTRNRMVYFLVFDSNDPESYEEALQQEKALYDYLQKKEVKDKPAVYLVGTKIDVNPWSDEFIQVSESAALKSTLEAIPCMQVSAMKFKGVRKLFRSAVQSVRMRQNLWLLESGIRLEADLGIEKCCIQ